jgi:hypothetical protein
MRQVASAVEHARIAMNNAKLSTTNPPFDTLTATPERTWRRLSSTRPHAPSDAARPMQAIQRWMPGRSRGSVSATIAEIAAAATRVVSGSNASQSGVVFIGGPIPTRSAW